ncbi:MAG: EAL domain-containing protein [Aliidiomarina sp.]|uniref:bifunctional diguanylate cyclase/phosphodiesterase n=1 Tax=Aliidiomarina sp. TaxID=1872439 RepID=UPI0025B8EF93|nr:EAL domain-containing protein [Aliidiomarina sp.]MCH8500717.1 EAL domain-containing protein [Aliidiomarina sp.]
MTYNSRTAASAAYYFAALTAVLLGLIGSFFHFSVSQQTLIDIIPMRTTAAVLVTGLAFLIAARRHSIILIVLGVGFMALAAISLYVNLTSGRLDVREYFAWVIVAVAIHLFLLGLSFALSLKWRWVRQLWKFTGWLSLAIAIAIIVYSWIPNTTHSYAPGSVIFIAVALMMLLTCIMMLIRAHWYREPLFFDRKLLTPSVVVSLITLLVWFSLSAAAVRDVNERGQILQGQIASQIDSQLIELRDALKRVASFKNAEDLEVFRHDSELLLRDFPAALGISVHSGSGDFVYLVHAQNRACEVDLRVLAIPPTNWLRSQMGQEAYSMSATSVMAERPVLFFTAPIISPNVEQNQQATMAVDLRALLDFETVEFLKAFSVYTEIAPNIILPANTVPFHVITNDHFHQMHPFSIEHAYQILDAPLNFYVTLHDTDELWRSARVNKLVFLIGGLVSFLLVIVIDANNRLRQEEVKLKQLATFDGVTNLIRRDVFEQELALQYSISEDIATTYVLFIDLDGFKTVNDTLGLKAGNHILHETGNRIKALLPTEAIVSRFSSDEFVVMVKHTNKALITKLAGAFQRELRRPYVIDDVEVVISASIGVAQASVRNDSADELIQRADIAMTEAKTAGGNTTTWFRKDMLASYNERLRLRTRIQQGLNNDEFRVHYQPIVSTKSGEISGFEALARWPQNDGSMISPGVFIPVTEQTGQIVELTEQILAMVSADIPRLAAIGGEERTYVSVNISPLCFTRGIVIELLKEIHLQAKESNVVLQIEVTESLFLDDKITAKATLEALRDSGIQVAIDDFGTGYSSLSLLYKLPVDVIKIDRAFISDLTPGSDAFKVADAAITLALNLNKVVVVEGIETEEQLKFCREKQCHAMQGFYFYKPEPLAVLMNMQHR